MKQNRKIEISVGITVFIGILILVLGIFWGKGTDWLSEKKVYCVEFENIYGLQQGDPVMVRGIQKGKIQKVMLHRNFVHVYFWLDPDIAIRSDYVIYVENKELMGGKQLTINPGIAEKILSQTDVLAGEPGGDPVALIGRLSKTLSSVDTVLSRLDTVMDVQKIDQVFSNLDQTLNRTQKFIQETREHLDLTFDHVDQLASQLEQDSTLSHMGKVIYTLDSTLYQINHVMMQIRDPNSTFGKLTTESVLYDSLLITVQHMDSLVQDIKKNPKRYIHLEIF